MEIATCHDEDTLAALMIFQMRDFKEVIFTIRIRSLREGDVFSLVSLSVHKGGFPM